MTNKEVKKCAQGSRTLDAGENMEMRTWCDAFGVPSCCSGQRRRPDKKQGTVDKWSVLCFALLLQSFSFFEPFCFVSLKHIFTIIRTRTTALPLHEALIFVVCPKALATPLLAFPQPLKQIAFFCCRGLATCWAQQLRSLTGLQK